ncbi:MAG: DUF977 family protein [Candidatus Heimdallarchaeota archaeon]
MAKTALKWVFGIILSVIGFFIAGVVLYGYFVTHKNSLGGLISGVVMGSVAFVPGTILLILAMIDIRKNAFDLRVANILDKYDRITPATLAKNAHASEAKVESSVSRIIGKGLLIVYFDKSTGEFVTQEGRAIAERVIGLIDSKRRTTIEQLTTETGMKADEIKKIVVGMAKRGLFSGTYDWKAGKILSAEAVHLLQKAPKNCPNCGATLSEPPLPGEEIKCDFCGHIVTG